MIRKMIPDLKLTGEPYPVKVGRRVRRGVVGKVLAIECHIYLNIYRQETHWLPTLPLPRVPFSRSVVRYNHRGFVKPASGQRRLSAVVSSLL